MFEYIKKMLGIKKYKVKNFTKRRKVGGRTQVYDTDSNQWLYWYLINDNVDDYNWVPELALGFCESESNDTNTMNITPTDDSNTTSFERVTRDIEDNYSSNTDYKPYYGSSSDDYSSSSSSSSSSYSSSSYDSGSSYSSSDSGGF